MAYQDGEIKRAGKKCCVPGCANKYGSFFTFPNKKKSPTLFRIWLEAVNNPELLWSSAGKPMKKAFICSAHFRREDLVLRGRRGLTWNAIPSLNMNKGALLRNPLLDPRDARARESIKIIHLKSAMRKSPSLPSKKTVVKLFKRISIRPGLQNEVYSVLKAEAQNISNPLEQYCILMFDKISIYPNLQPNYKNGTVEGFEDFGFKKTDKVADHAQVFMLCGLHQPWQQPVYFNFVSGETKPVDIVQVLKLVIRKYHNIGLKIIATVCDHTRSNRAAINALVNNTQRKYQKSNNRKCEEYHFEVDEQVIIPLFNVPHLFKGVRNHLLKYNLQFMDENQLKFAKWKDIETVYQMNLMSSPTGPKALPKLTDAHIMADKLNKTDVIKCIEVFSHSVASAIMAFVASGTIFVTPTGMVKMDEDAADTASLLEFLDQLFDSLNGYSYRRVAEKPLRTSVTIKTAHADFWNQAVEILDSFKFVKNDTLVVPASLKCLKISVKNFDNLWKRMNFLGFQSFLPRTFHKFHLEKFMEEIKKHSRTNLTSTKFSHYYRNSVISWLISGQYIGVNSGSDKSSMFRTLQLLVAQGLHEKQNTCSDTYCTVDDSFHVPVRAIETRVLTYVMGYVLKKVRNQPCDCKRNLFNTMDSLPCNKYFKECHRKDVRLKYVNSVFLNKLQYAIGTIKYILNRNINKSGIFDHILKTLDETISFTNCFHDNVLKKHIFKYLIKINVFNYCQKLNEIVLGLYTRKVSKNGPLIFKNAKKTFSLRFKRRKGAHRAGIIPAQ